MNKAKEGRDYEADAQADHWAREHGAEIEPVFDGDPQEIPLSVFESADSEESIGRMIISVDGEAHGEFAEPLSGSRDWEKPPVKAASVGAAHTITDVNDELRFGYCHAHSRRVRLIRRQARKTGRVRWSCAEQDRRINDRRRAREA